jgi:hypothetical protein
MSPGGEAHSESGFEKENCVSRPGEPVQSAEETQTETRDRLTVIWFGILAFLPAFVSVLPTFWMLYERPFSRWIDSLSYPAVRGLWEVELWIFFWVWVLAIPFAFGAYFWYLILVVRNRRLGVCTGTLWFFAIGLVPWIMMPVYWALYVWRLPYRRVHETYGL